MEKVKYKVVPVRLTEKAHAEFKAKCVEGDVSMQQVSSAMIQGFLDDGIQVMHMVQSAVSDTRLLAMAELDSRAFAIWKETGNWPGKDEYPYKKADPDE